MGSARNFSVEEGKLRSGWLRLISRRRKVNKDRLVSEISRTVGCQP